MAKNRKSDYHNSILHIQISLGTKFLFKLTVFIFLTRLAQADNLVFWTKFAQKGICSRKQKN